MDSQHSLNFYKSNFELAVMIRIVFWKNRKGSFDMTLPGYKTFQTPTECAKGGALLYIKENIDCKIYG